MKFHAGVLGLGLLASLPTLALESEQFTLPPVPLADLGSILSDKVSATISDVVHRTNGKIDRTDCPRKLAKYRSSDYLARKLYDEIAQGLPESRIEKWLGEVQIPQARTLYKPRVSDSIYAGVFAPAPFTFASASRSGVFFGTYFGVDKIGHFFQQGHDYLRRYRKARSEGSTPDGAESEAIAFGLTTEKTYYGTRMSGIFSNADLAANYAGLKFYLRLTEPVTIGEETLAPLLLLDEEGRWVFAPSERERSELLRPFFTEHFNEALNPSVYAFSQKRIAEAVRARCESWFARFPDMTLEGELERLRSMERWFGREYGHRLPEAKAITLANSCFAP